MRIKVKVNYVFGIFAIIVAVGLAVVTMFTVKSSTFVIEYVSGRFVPMLCAVVMGVCGGVSILTSFFKKDGGEKEFDVSIEKRTVFYMLMVVFYAMLVRYVSFLVASLLIGPASLYFMKVRSWKKYLVVELIILITCLVFKYVLNVKFGGLWGI